MVLKCAEVLKLNKGPHVDNLGPVQTSCYHHVELNCIKFDFGAIAARQFIQTSYIIVADLSQVVSAKHMFLAWKVF